MWITKKIFVDTANNKENILLLKDTLLSEKLIKPIMTIFGTTQIDPHYASYLAKIIPAEKRLLIDNFCERALPCSTYKRDVP